MMKLAVSFVALAIMLYAPTTLFAQDAAQPPNLTQERVDALRANLAHINRGTDPMSWANAQVALADALTESHLPNSATDALTAYGAALEVLTERDTPEQWADTEEKFGAALADHAAAMGMINILSIIGNPGGEAPDNGENDWAAAIRAYEAALEVRTQERAPLYWGRINRRLGEAYRAMAALALAHGPDNPEGLAAATLLSERSYRNSQQIYTRREHPLEWAIAEFGLAQLRALNRQLHEAISAAQAARDALAEAGQSDPNGIIQQRIDQWEDTAHR